MSIDRRIQISGLLVMIGMFIELITLLWPHPIAFILFILAGGLFMIAGIVYYLFSLVSIDKFSKPVTDGFQNR